MNHVVDKKITIIVSVLNGSKTLERCLLSIFEQTYENKEIIVIDGFSSDTTVDIIKKYSDNIDYWISEPDSGVYSAWNKAIRKSTGEWICFLGCDDYWSSSTSLIELAEYARYPQFNFVSGKMYLVSAEPDNDEDNFFPLVGQLLNCYRLQYGIRIAHVGALHHHSLFETYGFFDESYKIAGDYEFFIRACSSIRPAFVPKGIVCMGNSGLSQSNWRLTIKEGCRALRSSKDFGHFPAIQLYLTSYLAYFKKFLMSV
jgi:glycosyltransferase involved in cell wall biosynthesis